MATADFMIRRPGDQPGIEVIRGRSAQLAPVRHMHENYRVGMTIDGVFRTRYDGREFDVVPGAAQVAQPGSISTCEGDSFGEQAFVAVDLRPAEVRELLADSGLRAGVGSHVTHDRRIVDALRRFVRAVDDRASLLTRSATLNELVIATLVRGSPGAKATRPIEVSIAKEFIDDQPGVDIALNDLAAMVGMSPYHFSRVFREHIGLPPHAYQLHRRVERAKEALAVGSTPLSRIAEDLGFYDQSHLVRHFRSRVGVTPAAYRLAVVA